MSGYYMHMVLPTTVTDVYDEVKNIPFYKTETGYQYAAYLLTGGETPTVTQTVLAADNEAIGTLEWDYVRKLQGYLRNTIEKLSNIVVTDEVLNKWITFQKDEDEIREYHQCLEDFYEILILISFTRYLDSQVGEGQSVDQVISFCDINEDWEECRKAAQKVSNSVVLNHNNPFADISIEEQQFIYGSSYGQFETLGLTTSHTMTKVAKDAAKSYLALQPGFKIKKMKKTSDIKNQDILFDDTFTTEITQTDNNVYIYID